MCSIGGKNRSVHRLVYISIYGDIPDGLCVRHTCDVRNCVNPEHLLLGTQKQNMQDCANRGRAGLLYKNNPPYGEKNNAAKLSTAQVLEIRSLVAGGQTQTSVATQFGVKTITISDIIRRKNWKHLEEEYMLKNSAGEKVSPKKYAQDFLYNALVSARAAFSDTDLTDKETVKVNDQFDRLSKRANRVFGVKPAK